MPKLGLGLGLENNILLSSISAEALSWNTRANAASAGSGLSLTNLALIDNNFFKPMINAGLFAKFDRLNLYGLGIIGNEYLALQNTISSNFTVTKSASPPTFSTSGYSATSASTYLDLNYNLFTQAVKLSQDSITQFIVVKNVSFATVARSMAARTTTPANRVGIYKDVNQLSVYLSSATATPIAASTSYTGNVFLGGVRTGSASSVAYINKTIGTVSTVTSTTLPNLKVYELVENQNGSATGTHDSQIHLASGHGQALTQTEINTLQDILTNLWTVLGI